MSHIARLILSVFAAFIALLFATSVSADSFTVSYSGIAPDGTAVLGTLNLVGSPDGLGDGGFSITSITSGSLTLEGSSYTISGLTPLDGSPSPTFPAYDAYYITPGYHYDNYDNLWYPGKPQPVDYGGLLFYAGLGQPANLFCSSGGPCNLGIWVGQGSVLQSLFPSGGNNPPDHGFENYTVTFQQKSVPEPSTLLLLGAGLGLSMLVLAGFGRRA
jgi:hypothetical protein